MMKMINNKNFWIEAAKYLVEMLMICVMKYIHHVSYKDNVIELYMTDTIDK